MAATFPWKLSASANFKPELGITFGRDLGGLGLTGRTADAYWSGTLTTNALSIDDRQKALSDLLYWVDMNMRISFVHPQYSYPQGYDAGNWPVAGAVTVTTFTDRRHVTVSGLVAGMVLPRGTRFTFIQDDLRCYRMLPADVTVESAIAQPLQVSPRLPMGVFAPECEIGFVNPEVRLAIVPDSWQADEGLEPATLSFDVSETLV
jgi:hypothetical protein